MLPSRIIFAFIAVLALAACGSGGNPVSEAHDRIRELTGSLPPAESAAAITARVDDLVSRADSLFISSRHEETTRPGSTPVTLRSDCQAGVCTFHNPETGSSYTVRTEDFQSVGSVPAPVEGIRLTRNGITLGESGRDVKAYGAWMHHAVFAVHRARTTVEEEGASYDLLARYGIAGGDLTGTRPAAASASWRGVMVGTPATGASRGNVLQGDAALTLTLDEGRSTLDAAFTGIKDLDRLAAHPTEEVHFTDVPAASDGTFGAGSTGSRIQGGFYGPDHVETVGVFEHSNIVGAFGARRR